MEDRVTLVPDARPMVLAAGCDGHLLARCRLAAHRVHVDLDAVEVLELPEVVGMVRPLVVLLAADAYAFDPDEFDAVVRSVGASRLLVEPDEPIERLRARLAEALVQAQEARLRDPPPPSTVRGAALPTAGLRWAVAKTRINRPE